MTGDQPLNKIGVLTSGGDVQGMNAVHTALSFDLVGEDVLITGAGPIGIMAAAVCRHVGARHVVVTDINDYRLDLCNQVTDAVTVNVGKEDLKSAMQRIGMREGFDIGLEMSGRPRPSTRWSITSSWAARSRCSASRPDPRPLTGTG